jgi:hypothetical protein
LLRENLDRSLDRYALAELNPLPHALFAGIDDLDHPAANGGKRPAVIGGRRVSTNKNLIRPRSRSQCIRHLVSNPVALDDDV